MVLLHGCTQNAAELVAMSGWGRMADERGCYLLCPEQRRGNNASGCFNWFRHDDIDSLSGEAASIAGMTRWAIEHYPIDPQRVFIYGVSAGGAMASAVLAQYPSLFRAGAVIAGGPFFGDINALKGLRALVDPPDLAPADWSGLITALHPGYNGHWPRLLVMHGDDDRTVDPRISEELIEQWTALHGTDALADSTVQEPGGANRTGYRNASGEEVVVHYRMAGMKHVLPVSPGEAPCQGGMETRWSVATAFHSTCAVARWWGL